MAILRVLGQIGVHRVREPALADGGDEREDNQGSADDLNQPHALRRKAVAASDVAEQPAQQFE